MTMTDVTEEAKIWSGSPSQVLNLPAYALVVLLLVPTFGLALLYALWKYLELRARQFELTNQRLTSHSGVFSRVTDEIELFRVKDTRFEQPFWLRIFGLGNVILVSGDQTTPVQVIPAVPDGARLREAIRNAVEQRRAQKQVRAFESE